MHTIQDQEKVAEKSLTGPRRFADYGSHLRVLSTGVVPDTSDAAC
jgi:hypothetical protein